MKVIEGKVVLLGAQAVGKTSLLMRYVNKTFDSHSPPTIGASFCTCNVQIGDIGIVLQVWDTAGMERFRSMAPMYYRKTNAALLVFDLTNQESFAMVKSWVSELKRNIEEAIILIVVGNKSDCVKERKIDSEEGRKYAVSIGAFYHETSALYGDGIETVFQNIATEMLKLTEHKHLITSIRVYDSDVDDNILVTPASEDFHDNSIAHGVHEKPFFCC
ncbi:ras-related protein Rab-31-like [Leptopilina heterotoma]|uniref:ras-related protein Rab-31-like n=1 Tax=Leptopilina heterotoma TaxID=63436 RepID=UPI001CA8DADE|nr:ras-related protein Rab-31-like [Leptopilina heterotoma]